MTHYTVSYQGKARTLISRHCLECGHSVTDLLAIEAYDEKLAELKLAEIRIKELERKLEERSL